MRRVACAFALAALGLPATSAAQARAMLNGTFDAELRDTDTLSNLLTRNAGRPSPAGRLMLWGAVEPAPRLVLYALLDASVESRIDSTAYDLEQIGVRYTRSPHLVLDAGRITMPLGAFAGRRFSWRNPLVGEPDAYPVQYPYGAVLSGAASAFDYRVGIVSLPAVHEEYTPKPTHAPRPVVGVGVTPFIGARLGLGYTWGPYLNDTLSATELDGRSWRAYEQRVAVADLSLSYGYLELSAEAGTSRYEVPRTAEPIDGFAYFIEGKYTLTPRVYVATRLERNDYPFIRPVNPTFWVARKTDFHNEEFGVGYRLGAWTLLKAAYRQDRWHVNAANGAFVRPGGRAVAVQLSQRFDVLGWFRRP